MTTRLTSYVLGKWHDGTGNARTLHNATTEDVIAECHAGGIDMAEVLDFARTQGGPALRAMSFPERGAMLKALSGAMYEHREELIDLSIHNAGTTRKDSKFDIDGATGTLAAYAHFAASMPERGFVSDGEGIQLGRTARFWGQHIAVPLEGAALHINAFNFPAWNMMEKAACALLAGMPVIEKPGTPTAMVAWRIAQIAAESKLLPKGAFQFLVGIPDGMLDALRHQDCVAFTGSSWTALKLKSNENVLRHNVRFNVEADSLNAAILGPDADGGSETYRLFVRNVALDMRQKTGQKCTAVRRVLVPTDRVDEVRADLRAELEAIVVGDPAEKATTMGPLASAAQLRDVRAGIDKLAAAAEVLCGGSDAVRDKGYFVAPTLLQANEPMADIIHDEEVFGPVATILPYDGSAGAAARIANRGLGCLVSSLYSNDNDFMATATRAMAPWHGRIWAGSDRMAEQSLPPGMVLPAMIHGGPGRAGGGEELGGLRGLAFYMQRTAIQGFKTQVHGAFGTPAQPAAV